MQSRRSVLEVLGQSASAFDARLRETIERRDEALFADRAAERKLSELRSFKGDLEAEVEILETNEVAAGAFRSLCGNEACQFFRRPEESYGRRLLYLKDQLKDFETSFSMLIHEAEGLKANLADHEAAVARATEEKRRTAESIDQRLVAAVDETTAELARVNLRLDRLERVEREKERLNELINRGLRAEEEVNQLRPTRGPAIDQAKIVEARTILGSSMQEWLRTLRTQNVSLDIVVDEEFRLRFGEERFSESSSHSGSTRTRIVLAYHAALLETSLKMGAAIPCS